MADSPSPSTIRFYFDFISPYAFLAWTQIRKISEGHRLEPVPVLFAALLDKNGQKGPAEIPPKRRYLFKDVARKAWRYRVNVLPPPAHPFNPLTALRVVGAIEDAAVKERAIDALYMAAWTKRTAIDSPEAVGRVVDEAGLPGGLVEAGGTQAAKDQLRASTDAAIAENVFGVPTMIVNGSELFWGTDSLVDLEAFLKGDLPAFSDAGWLDLPRAADRKAVHKG